VSLAKLRKIALALPETHEELTWEDHPTFRAQEDLRDRRG